MTDIADMTDNKVYSVVEICSDIKKYVGGNADFKNIYVEGEVTNLKNKSGVHLYFYLTQKVQNQWRKNGYETLILPVAIFNWRETLGTSTVPIDNGDKIIVFGSIDIYKDGGQYQIKATNISLQGSGIIDQKLAALRKKLSNEGLFDKAHKRPIPKYAFRVGIVTSDEGDAIGDIIKVAKKRNRYVQLLLYPSMVQGDAAARDIVKGIEEIQNHNVDVIIVGRGGGSSVGLDVFNEESVARAIYRCNVPVISAVGHRRDRPISDDVADAYAVTPTEAANMAVFDVSLVLDQLKDMSDAVSKRMNDRKNQAAQNIETYSLKLETKNPKNILSEERREVKEFERLLEKKNPALLVKDRRTTIKGYEGELAKRHPDIRIRDCRKRVEDIGSRLSVRMYLIYNNMRHRVQIMSGDLEAQSPLKKLDSGYAFLTRDDGQRISCVDGLPPGTRIRAYMRDGSFTAVVDEVETDNAAED